MPDILGLTLQEARRLLDECGIKYTIESAAPFFRGEPIPAEKGVMRIIGTKNTDSGTVVIACCIPGGEEDDRC